MNRADYQKIAEERIANAEALLVSERWTGAYYLAGYSVECGLKAVIAKRTYAGDYPPKDAAKLYSHNLQDLLRFAGLGGSNGAITVPGHAVAVTDNWNIAKTWSEVVRYETRTEQQARLLVQAVNHSTEGVLSWIRTHW